MEPTTHEWDISKFYWNRTLSRYKIENMSNNVININVMHHYSYSLIIL